jgi:GntR family transcriptional regulator/MocR family aminotransferase
MSLAVHFGDAHLCPPKQRRRALEEHLRDAIRSGQLGPGARLPSSRALAEDLGLARTTVTEAYGQLELEGYLDTRRGAGTWVANLALTPRRAAVPENRSARQLRFSFNPGVPDLSAFPHTAWAKSLLEALRESPSSALGYGDPRGLRELRVALADYLGRTRGVVADPELVVVCAGFSHGLSLIARVLRAKGLRRIAMEDPCLRWHREIAAAAGLEIVPLQVDGYGARTDLLADGGSGAAVLAPAHQFPLGCVLSSQRRAAAITWARTTGGLVIEDDYDAELRYDRTPIGALQALDPDRVIFAGTVSKSLAPGLRLGWMVVPESLIDPIVRLRRTDGAHLPVTEQMTFAQFLATGRFERHIRRMRVRYRKRRQRLLELLADRVPEAKPVGVSAGLRVLLELPSSGPPASSIAERAAEDSVELFPVGPCYHAGGSPPGHDGLVLGYAALPEHDFDSGLDALDELLATSFAASKDSVRPIQRALRPLSHGRSRDPWRSDSGTSDLWRSTPS